MAEITGLRNNALPYPIYGAPWGIVVPIFDADGDLVAGAAGLDSEISLNGDTFADCTNEATQIATDSGMYCLLLTAAEMTADAIAGIIKTSTVGAKTTPFTLYPRKLVALHSGTAAGGDVAYITLDAGASAVDDFYNGMVCIATIDGNVEARVISDYTGSNKRAAVTPAWNVAPDNDDTFVIKLPEGVQIQQANMTHILGLATPTPGAAGGLFIAGTNAATTITSSTGSALTLTSTGSNGSGLNATGNGSGDGIKATGGATGAGLRAVGGATSGAGLYATAGGASNYGIEAVGAGATDSGGIKATATTAGEGFEGRAAGNGHGMLIIGAGSGEGLHATAGPAANGHGAHFEGVGANSHGALFSRGGSGGDDMAFQTNDVTIANVTNVGTTATVTNAVLISSGSGAGQLDITSGVVKANLAEILGTALTEGAGQIAAAFKKFFNVAAPTGTVNSLPDAIAGAASGVAIVGSAMTLAADQDVNVAKISGSSTAADNLEASALAVVTGTAVTGTLTATGFTTSLSEATDNHYNGRVCVFTSGVLAGQAKAVIDYDGASKLLTTQAFTEAPSNLDAFVLV